MVVCQGVGVIVDYVCLIVLMNIVLWDVFVDMNCFYVVFNEGEDLKYFVYGVWFCIGNQEGCCLIKCFKGFSVDVYQGFCIFFCVDDIEFGVVGNCVICYVLLNFIDGKFYNVGVFEFEYELVYGVGSVVKFELFDEFLQWMVSCFNVGMVMVIDFGCFNVEFLLENVGVFCILGFR